MANAVKNDKNYRNAIGEKLQGGFIIERASAMAVNEEGEQDSRIVELSFASNTPIPHWFGYLELDITESSCRLERLREGGALLWNHRSSDQIGVCESVTLDKDGKARANVKFSRSQIGQENYQDVIDGIKRNVSVGFIPHTIEQKVDAKGKQVFENGEPVYVSRDWEPFEISLVSIPADKSVGVGRSLDNFEGEKREMEENPTTQTEPAVIPPVVVDTRSEAEKRDDLFIAIGRKFGNEELAKRYALGGKTEAELRQALFDAIPATDAQPAAAATVAQRNNSPVLARTNRRVQLKGFRGKDADEQAHRFGQFLNAAFYKSERSMQFCKDNGIIISRAAQTESENEYGGFLVPTEFENAIVDLRLEYGVFRANANVVPMSSDAKSRPRRKGGLTAYPIGAVGTSRRITESRKNWDRVNLLAKKWGVLAKYEEELGEDAIIGIADDLINEIAYSFTEVEDDCGFNGIGTSDYHGIVGVIPSLTNLSGTVANIAGLQVASGNLWSEVVLADILGMVGKLPSFARKTGAVKWYCSNEFWATVLVRIAASLGGTALAQLQDEVAPRFLGKPVELVEVMPHSEANSQVALLYGNLAQGAMFGDRRGVTIKQTDSNDTDFEEDLMAIKGTERFDINVHDVGNASATAADRKAGPIVGLITAAS